MSEEKLKQLLRGRAFCFTVNNYTGDDVSNLLDTVFTIAKYITFGYEVGESGTPHLQGFVYFGAAKTRSAVSKLIPRAHIEFKSSRSTFAEAIQYCQKDGNYVESGDRPLDNGEKGKLQVNRWKRTVELAKMGNIDEIDPELFIRFDLWEKFLNRSK